MSEQLAKQSLNGGLVQQIKMLQKQAGLDDESYRALLSGYGVESCKWLTLSNAHRVIVFLRSLVPAGSARPKKYEYLGYRQGMGIPSQLRMLEAMWKEVSYQPTPKKRQEAWLVFLKNRFDRISMEHIEQEMVGKIVKVLQAMQRSKKDAEKKPHG